MQEDRIRQKPCNSSPKKNETQGTNQWNLSIKTFWTNTVQTDKRWAILTLAIKISNSRHTNVSFIVMVKIAVLRDCFCILQIEMRANALDRQIQDFSGKGGKRFKDRLGDIDSCN